MKDFKRSACPELWLRIKCTSLTLSKGQGEAKNPDSQVRSSGGGAESCCSAYGFKPFDVSHRARGMQLGSGAKILGDGDGI